ncbi:hypothetical protein BRADI_4g42930v3 [Brachypodium distachyon]|uniref:RING-type domain-containing protein n=1 Tax=Brachypodium distachyon TaxID=15368 RepID=I1IUH5_BRADI|nr:hypothetical protein BRADI_4g42930v3 [Brachypodium distachyon]
MLAQALEIEYPLPGDEDDLPRLVITIRRRTAGAAAGIDAVPPASSEAMAALPEKTGSETMEKSCAVCLEKFKAEEKLREMPCGHCYHSGCIRSSHGCASAVPARSDAKGCRQKKRGDGFKLDLYELC